MITTVSIIGTGNVATQIAISLHQIGIQVDMIAGRDLARAQKLACKVGANASDDISSCDFTSQLLIISVNDDAYPAVISQLKKPVNAIVIHTSGSVPMSVFESQIQDFGVFYLLQTFSVNKHVPLNHVPICLEASSEKVYTELESLAMRLSTDVQKIDSPQRQQIHIAAVFGCNFVNFLYCSAKEMLQKNNLPFELLHPLILETAQKAIEMGPENAQTGPAKRGDIQVINKHQSLIEDRRLKELYLLLSDQILNKYNS